MPPPLLLVEDDPFLGEALRDFFASEGLDLLVAATTAEARRRMAGFRERGIVLVDPIAVSLDGAWIRRVASSGHVVVVIAVTIHNSMQRGETPDPRGGPMRRVLSPESLVQTVRELIDRSRLTAFAA